MAKINTSTASDINMLLSERRYVYWNTGALKRRSNKAERVASKALTTADVVNAELLDTEFDEEYDEFSGEVFVYDRDFNG